MTVTIRLRTFWALVAVTLVVAAAPTVLWGQNQDQDQSVLLPVPTAAEKKAEAAKLVVLLQSDAATIDKAKACRRLALIGDKDAVPALASLLADERLTSYARFGLEPIPDPSVDDVLRDALGKLRGAPLVGVINSVGVRCDVKAVAALVKLLGDPTPEVTAKALVSLAEIASPEAVEAIHRSLKSESAAIRAAAAEASLIGYERLVVQNKRDEAIRLCDAARQADVPRQLRAAATRGAILTRQSAGVALLLEQLKAEDVELLGAALRTSRELPGSDVTQALVAELERLPAVRQVLLIRAIGDRQDAAALPAIRQRAAGGPREVRSAAMDVLGQLGDVSAVPVLLEAASSGEPALVQSAQASLKKLRGNAVDEAIVTSLDRAAPNARVAMLDFVGQLGIASATPVVLKAAVDSDEAVRLVAIKTLGRIVGLKEFSVLADRLLAAKSPQEVAAAQEALKAACSRMPDPDACVAKILDCMASAPITSKCFLVELLGTVGGARALTAVSAAAENSSAELQDAATRVLGKWTTADAAPELLKLARTLSGDKLKTRSLRGYIRVIQQMKLPPEQKMQMCDEAFHAAQRDEERRLVLAILGRIPTAKAMSMIVPHLASASLKEDAAAAALAIGEKTVQAQPRMVAEAMQAVLKSDVSKEKAAQAKRLLGRSGS